MNQNEEIKLVTEKADCCGCSACQAVCSQHAIQMRMDDFGHQYPQIDNSLCVGCGLCLRSCKFKIHRRWEELPVSKKATFVAVANNIDLKESASGGVFSGIAKTVLENGGVVYGSHMNCIETGFHTGHIRITDIRDLLLLKGSKYIQSDISNCFVHVKEDLQAGEIVLFSGTPCQIAGVKGYLGKYYDNLYTIEIICHGVPSESFFNSYIKYSETQLKGQIREFCFRDKSKGWKLQGKLVLEKENGDILNHYFEPEKSSYYQMFLNAYTYRDSCYSCPYASDHRAGDITIGDFWCIDLVHPKLLEENSEYLTEEKGISCLIVNTNQGERLLEQNGSGIKKWESSYENASKYNGQLLHPSMLKPERETVKDLYQDGYEQVEVWYQRRLRKIKWARQLRSLVPQPLKKIIRLILEISIRGKHDE